MLRHRRDARRRVLRLLGNGREYGLDLLHLRLQEQAGGIAEALALAEHFVARDRSA